MRISKIPMFFPILLLTGTSSFGGVINFSGLDDPGTNRNSVASYDVGGFTFSGSGLTGAWTTGDTGSIIAGVPDNPTGGVASVSLSTYFAGGVITMTRDNGGTFGILSIDVAQWAAYANGFSGVYSATFQGFDAGNSLIASQVCSGADVDGQPVLSTCAFSGFDGVTSMSVEEGTYASGLAFQFTNVVTADGSAPEPGSLWLLGTGLLCIGILHRNRGRRPSHAST